MFDKSAGKLFAVLKQQVLEFFGAIEGSVVGQRAGSIDGRILSFSGGYVFACSPLPDGIVLIKSQTQWVDRFVASCAIGIFGVGLNALTDSDLIPLRGDGFDRVNVGWRCGVVSC